MGIKPLEPDQLYHRCDPAILNFKTTEDVADLADVIGQPRAVDAVRFGVGIRREGYNLYALGPAGTGKYSLVHRYVAEQAATEAVPFDWCYINNFEQAHKPRALRMPPGKGVGLARDMDQLVDELRVAIPAVFDSEDYRTRLQSIEEEYKEHQEKAFSKIQEDAKAHGIALIRTPTGFAFAPARDNEVISPDEYEKLDAEERKRVEHDVAELQQQLEKTLHLVPTWRKESRDKVNALNQEMAGYAVTSLIGELRQKYQALPEVVSYLDEVEKDIVAHANDFRRTEEETPASPFLEIPQGLDHKALFRRYKVNVVMDHDEDKGAPVVYEDNPTYQNLVGRVEHMAQMGALVTDFTMIKSGSLHRANGGYLILDARKVLLQPYAWDGLKRALQAGEIRIESLGQLFSLVSTVSLEAEPIPLNVKVVLLGDRELYYLLSYYDPDFAELFKVAADFDDRMERSNETSAQYTQLIATLVRKESLRHFDSGAVARVIEYSSRTVEDNQRLSTHMRSIADLLRESDYWAQHNNHAVVGAGDVEQAIDKQIYRSDRVREHIQEAIRRDVIFIDTDGERVGQANGLSVISLGDFSFGQPSRITASVRLGEFNVVDIEREVELSGPFHSKGVLILSGFLKARYCPDRPLSLVASLVFEQSYAEIDGDSASSAELYTLLSALAQAPIKQSFAITGSVNQYGDIQPIGGVNEKIEGFFDVCKARGLTGEHGVMIPASNVEHLMLRADVVQAVRDGTFNVFPVHTVDEGIELLTGLVAGERDADGNYPEDSINGRVEARLLAFSEKMHAFMAKSSDDNDEKDEEAADDGDGDES